MGKTAEQLPKGKIVGSVEIVDCKPHLIEKFAYKLANPKRLQKHLIPKNSHEHTRASFIKSAAPS